jgi:hypothetical protein
MGGGVSRQQQAVGGEGGRCGFDLSDIGIPAATAFFE